jgi:pimeloyl-ACP methyl ester carboxylesterase
VWVRDIRQVVEDAIVRAKPTNGKVTLIGYSAGAIRVGRALYQSDADVPWNRRDDVEFVMQKTERVVFMSPAMLGPNEEAATAAVPFATFPLTLTAKSREDRWDMLEERHLACTGHVVEGSRDQQWDQILAQDPIGAQWGGSDPERPLGLMRSPTFSTYGFNPSVGGKIDKPVLVLQGMDDTQAQPANSCALYNTLGTTRKVLVQVDCASHQMHIEGCSGTRCAHSEPAYGTPGTANFEGPHTTVQAALVEWIKDGRFNGSEAGRYVVGTNGVVSAGAGKCPP